jgi:NAD+ synthetase
VSASPYTVEKRHLRPRLLAATARRWRRPLVVVNQVGGQDDLVFDGASLALDPAGEVFARGREHDADLVVCDVDARAGTIAPLEASDEASALAADALGPPHVTGVSMPARYSSSNSLSDAEALARNLGIDFTVIPIEPMLSAYLDNLADPLERFAPPPPASKPGAAAVAADLTQQNLQARVRGAILMALSNRQGRLLLSTGNKSEIATGYCTLYGDMAGGLAVISDVPKTWVYRLSRTINAERVIIPPTTLDKPPSAELRPNQTDQDELPPYDVLDDILDAHLAGGLDLDALVARGFDAAVAGDVVRRVRLSEYKRRQMPPGLKITGKAFGPGRRYPIARV